MSQGRQSLGYHITSALRKHFELHSKKKDHSVCVNIPTVWQCLNTGCSAIPGLETILVPKHSEKDQIYMSLLKIPRTLVLTLRKKSFKTLLLQIIHAAFREQGKRLVCILAPSCLLQSVWVGCWAVTAEFPYAVSWFQLSRTSNAVRCPVAGHWTEQPETHSALQPCPNSPWDHQEDMIQKPHMQHHATSGEIPVSSANVFGWLGEAQMWLCCWVHRTVLSWSTCVAELVFCFESTPCTLVWRVWKGRRRINRMRGKSFSISRSGSCMPVLRQQQRAGPTYLLDRCLAKVVCAFFPVELGGFSRRLSSVFPPG